MTQPDQRLSIVEYLRGLAALSVAWFHLTNTYDPNSLVRLSGSHGWLGVQVFFVISGFIIPYALATATRDYSILDFPRFIFRRLVRLEPPYLVSIVLALGLWHLSAIAPGFKGGPPPSDPGQVGAHLLYLVPLTGHAWLQPVYWTLAWEFVFYILVGLLFPWFGTQQSHLRLAALLLVVKACVFISLIPMLTCLFALGIAAQKVFIAIWRNGEGRHQTNKIAVAGFALLAAGDVLMMARSSIEVALVGASAALLIVGLPTFSLAGPVGRSLAWLGAISYSLYLVHVPVGGRIVNLSRRFIDGPWQEFIVSLAALFCSLIFAALFHAIIERTALNWSRQIRYRTPRAATAVVGA